MSAVSDMHNYQYIGVPLQHVKDGKDQGIK